MHDSFSHLISFLLLSFCGFAFLSLLLAKYSRQTVEGYRRGVVYGISLFACGLCSYLYTTGYSGLPLPLLKSFDHAAIFLLIAGTYTPFATNLILGPFRIRLLTWIWGIALTGILLRLIISTGHDKLFIALYLATGWTFLTALREIVRRLPRVPLIFLALGAVVYSAGAVLFALDPGPWTVAVWHGFVLLAAALHFVAVVNVGRYRGLYAEEPCIRSS